MKLRQLILETVIRVTGEAKLKAIKVVGDAAAVSLRGLSSTAESMAVSLERSATRGAAAMRDLGAAAKAVGRTRSDASGAGRDAAGPRPAFQGRPASGDAGANKAAAMGAGLADGSVAIKSAATALNAFSSKSDRAKAAVEDLTSKVERNRREMAGLKVEAVKTGDADGTLAARMKGLAVATGQAQVELAKARRELRAVDGGLIETIKNAARAEKSFGAIRVAAGNLISGAVSKAIHGIADGLLGATDKAIKFESAFTSISKVLDDKSPENLAKIDADIKKMSTSLGVVPTQIADMTAALAASGLQDDLTGYTEDAAKLAVAFELTGQEAGHAIASLTASLGLSRTEMQSLMGTANELDAEMNSSAKQLVGYMEEVAGIGRAASISGQTMLAFGSAIISTGVNEEKAATGVKNLIATMEAGSAATDAQRAAFTKLGLSAVDVAKEMASGNAEAQLKAMVKAIGALPGEERFATLINLFGRESIGNVGGLATNVDLLGKAFKIAGDKAAAAGSVQTEYDRVSQTTAHRLEKLKANVEVLAIEFGNALLPSITAVTDYLSSAEGQEWGRAAIKDLIAAVRGVIKAAQDAWPVVQEFGGAIVSVTQAVGGGKIAIVAMAAALVGLVGPMGAVLIASTALGAYLGETFVQSVDSSMESLLQAKENYEGVVRSLAEGRSVFGETSDILVQMADSTDRSRRAFAEFMLQIIGTSEQLDMFYAKERENLIRNGKLTEEQDRKNYEAAQRRKHGERSQQARQEDDRRKQQSAAARGGPERGSGRAPNGRGRGPAGAGPGDGGGGWTDEQKRIIAEQERLSGSHVAVGSQAVDVGGVLDLDKTGFASRLAGAGKHKDEFTVAEWIRKNPKLAAIATMGRTVDKHGVMSGPSNDLDKALQERGTQYLPSLNLGVSGPRGGPGAVAPPALSNTYNQHQTNTINQQISVPPNSSPTLEGRLRAAGQTIAHDTLTGLAQAEIIFTGGSR